MGRGVGNEIVRKGADYETLRNSKATINSEFHLERGGSQPQVSLLSTPTVSSAPGEYNYFSAVANVIITAVASSYCSGLMYR